ncbi:U3 small nucleolar RNA-associated protein 15 [Ophiocordyceps sinensis CO18]|uniref:U3 small nucleolar RNA-associated protein 15 n=1 Tax=Ophiocordyceps sinensis (strain Co18 / CGMCC 3.14243) TaxID=911162 RepID=T5AJF2_OPHSC|nr:U3 small nucleolar RNA-associated protein 15 [Ophiocordyceps sinensis CO18]
MDTKERGALDLYAEYVGGSAELHEGFGTLHRRVKLEVERAQMATLTSGMIDSLVVGAAQ